MQIKEIRIEAGKALDIISIQISEIALTAMTLKLQEVADFGVFFPVL